MSDSRRTLKALHQLALAHLGPASAALKTREALEAALEQMLAQRAAPAPLPAAVSGFEVRGPLVVKAPFRPLEAPVLPGPFADDQVLVFPRDAASVMASWDLSGRGPAVLLVREGATVLRRLEGLAPMGTLQLDGLADAHTITIELVQAARAVARSKPLTLPGRPVRQPPVAHGAAPATAASGVRAGVPDSSAAAAGAAQQGGTSAQPLTAGGAASAPDLGSPLATGQAPAGAAPPDEPGSSRAARGFVEPASSRSGERRTEPGSSRAAPGSVEPASSRSGQRDTEPGSSRAALGFVEPASSRAGQRRSSPAGLAIAAPPAGARAAPAAVARPAVTPGGVPRSPRG